ncbi:gastrula zinc finger protein XlCGF8.2DB [Armigeres subalbatus]|uniref:gastrula zinc finger protein XlCGF8.2DB n=1 Tax=Armigeres subalbatus TaxID=124917 RepID=UPI002ED5052E
MEHADDTDVDIEQFQPSSTKHTDDGKESLEYNCKYCDMSFSCVEEHIREFHENEDVIVEVVEDEVTCSYGFEEIVDTEELSAEDESNEFNCNICSTKLRSSRSLKMHMRIHGVKIANTGTTRNETHFLCDICNRSFKSDEHLQLHLSAHGTTATEDDTTSSVHSTNQIGYPCTYCGKRFKRPYEKVKHERIHTGEKPYACDTCGKRFRVSNCLAIHKRTHDDLRPYVCSHCKKRFKTQSTYDHHLKIHSNDRCYQCSFCSKSFKTAVQLNGHEKSHTKPFSCSECNRPFGSLYAVRKHMEIHLQASNKLSHCCTICGANYAREFALRDHRKQQHGIVDQQPDDVEIDENSSEIVETSTATVLFEECEEIIEEEMLF